MLPKIHADLRRIAGLYLKGTPRPHFQPHRSGPRHLYSVLHPGTGPWNSREHFFAIAAINVRRRLIEHAGHGVPRNEAARWIRVDLTESLPAQPESWSELLDVEAALQRLEGLNKRQSRVVEMRVFGGMTVEETADTLQVSASTVKADWGVATAFLRRELRAYRDTSSMGTN